MRLGIIDMVGLAASLIFAIPVGMFGLNTFLDGQHILGAGLLLVAVLMVYLPRYLTTPADIPGTIAEKTIGAAVKTPDDDK